MKSGVIDLSIRPREQLFPGRLMLRIILAIVALVGVVALAMLPAPAGAASQSVQIKMAVTPAGLRAGQGDGESGSAGRMD